MIPLLIIAVILIAVCLLPVGAQVEYSREGFTVKLILGPVWLQLIPAKARKEKKAKDKKEKVEKKEEKPKKGGSLKDFQELIPSALDAVGKISQGIRINSLKLYYTAASGDPANAAIQYGIAWVAVGNVIALIENVFIVKNRDVQVFLDYNTNKPAVVFSVNATIAVWRGITIGFRLIFKFFKIYIKQRKGVSKNGAPN